MVRCAIFAASLAAIASMAGAQTNVTLGPMVQDTSLPVEVTSDVLTVQNEAGIAIFEGNVVVVQGTMRLTAPWVKVEYSEKEDPEAADIDQMTARGGVTFVNGIDAAESEEAIYRPDAGDLVMTGEVLLTQGPNIMSGQRLTVDLIAGTGLMEGRTRTIFQSEGN